jgi:hypothetical protein
LGDPAILGSKTVVGIYGKDCAVTGGERTKHINAAIRKAVLAADQGPAQGADLLAKASILRDVETLRYGIIIQPSSTDKHRTDSQNKTRLFPLCFAERGPESEGSITRPDIALPDRRKSGDDALAKGKSTGQKVADGGGGVEDKGRLMMEGLSRFS